MKIGVFADSHDHLDHIRQAVDLFNAADCDLVLFAGDLVSSFAIPPLRELRCRIVACFGDNEGNKSGLLAGFKILGTLAEPPVGIRLADGTRIVLAHMLRQFRGADGDFDIAVFAHTHRPAIWHDDYGRLYVNPGEASGWSYRQPTIAVIDTSNRTAELVSLLTGQPCPLPKPPERRKPADQDGDEDSYGI